MHRQGNSRGKTVDQSPACRSRSNSMRQDSAECVVQEIAIEDLDSGIRVIRMQDRVNKNTFSAELSVGLIDAFENIAAQRDLKVVVLTGYDTYFASGGTKQGLLTLQSGEGGTFADVNLYSLALDCEIPVISAMQGHGIGGGFVMGLYADFVVMALESVYTTNFMKYGFTPGLGATYIMEKKLGKALTQEMLIAAGTFRGATLKERGIPFPVLPRDEVLPYSINLAKLIAEKPREALVVLKRHLVRDMRAELPDFIAREVAMHAETFHDDAVKDRISSLFGR